MPGCGWLTARSPTRISGRRPPPRITTSAEPRPAHGSGSSGSCCARRPGDGRPGNEAGDAQREVRVLVCYLPGGAGAVVAEPAGDAEAHLEDRERGERRGLDVEVACGRAIGDDGAHRSHVIP